MAIDKPSLNNFLPNGFETQDKTGYKANFDADKIATGFDKDTLEVLSGPNLNNLLDKTGKNFNVLEQFLTFFRDMPIGSFPITNASNQLDYKSVNSFFRNVGELVFSAIPLEDGNLRLLDGSLLEYTMTYSRFITYIAGLRASLPNLFCTQAQFDQSVATYGVCGKFVYDTVTKSLRLPKISGFIKGTLDQGSLGDIDEAKAPNITGDFCADNTQVGNSQEGGSHAPRGAFYKKATISNFDLKSDSSSQNGGTLGFDASRSSSVYKNGVTTLEPQSIKEFIYMVVSIDEAEKQVLSAVYNYKGSVPTYADLPEAVAIGEVYNVIGEDPEGYSGANVAWTGEEWDRLGGTVNLSGYLPKTEAANTYATKISLESNVDNLQEQINTNATNIANIASQEVIDAGIRKIEMLKFASTLGIGKVADTDLFEQIRTMKRSSFDVTKFTKFGTLTITSDGIASGFSTSNYLKKTDLIPLTFNKLAVKCKFKASETIAFDSIFSLYTSSSAQKINLIFNYNKISLTSGNTIFSTLTSTNSWVANTEYLAKVEIDTTLNKVFLDIYNPDGTVFYSNETAITIDLDTTKIFTLLLGISSNAAYPLIYGQIDLKEFIIEVNDEEVFNGNKQGLDIIKADDYTVVGSPTISDDGVVSNFSSSNYLKTIMFQPTATQSWKIECVVTTGAVTDTGAGRYLLGYAGAAGGSAILFQSYQNSLGIYLKTANSGSNILAINAGNLTSNTKYKFELSCDGNLTYTGRILDMNGVVLNSDTKSVVEAVSFPNTLLSLGYNGWSYFTGSIDLNAFKIYVNGDLVYQPMLRIPYNLSKTNLKITDKLDRAIDLAEQCGFSQYYGLDEDNMLCLVPQGENITGRRDLVSRTEDSSTHYVTEIYSDLYCKQMGSGTASTAVTLDIPYKDANYKLSVPQSAKSKTGFTPTATCDWTAEGYIYLDEVI